jgi:hypothetical protein
MERTRLTKVRKGYERHGPCQSSLRVLTLMTRECESKRSCDASQREWLRQHHGRDGYLPEERGVASQYGQGCGNSCFFSRYSLVAGPGNGERTSAEVVHRRDAIPKTTYYHSTRSFIWNFREACFSARQSWIPPKSSPVPGVEILLRGARKWGWLNIFEAAIV